MYYQLHSSAPPRYGIPKTAYTLLKLTLTGRNSSELLSVSTMSLSSSKATGGATKTSSMPIFWCSTVTTIIPMTKKTGSYRMISQISCRVFLMSHTPVEMTTCKREKSLPGRVFMPSFRSTVSPVRKNTHCSSRKPPSCFRFLITMRWMPDGFSSAPRLAR